MIKEYGKCLLTLPNNTFTLCLSCLTCGTELGVPLRTHRAPSFPSPVANQDASGNKQGFPIIQNS